MIHALHGNLGQPSDWDGLGLADLSAADLWEWQERVPGIGLNSFGEAYSQSVGRWDSTSVVMGYSLGGRLALHALLARPELWKGAVVISAHPGLKTRKEREARIEVDRAWAQLARQGEWGAFLMEWNVQPVFAGTPLGGESQRSLISRRDSIALAFEHWSLGCQSSLDQAVAKLEMPILWVTGEKDEKFTRLGAEMADLSPSIRHEVIPGAGHRVIQDAPETLRELVGAFLKDNRLT